MAENQVKSNLPPSVPLTSAVALLMICERPRLVNEIPPIIFNRLMRTGLVETFNAVVEGLGVKRLHVRATAEGHAQALQTDGVKKPGPGDDAAAVESMPKKIGRLLL